MRRNGGKRFWIRDFRIWIQLYAGYTKIATCRNSENWRKIGSYIGKHKEKWDKALKNIGQKLYNNTEQPLPIFK
jgi:hypothetical protein